MYPRSSNSADSFETAFAGIRSWARSKVQVLFTNSSGAAALEYSVLAASIAVAIIVAVTGLGTQVTTLYDEVVVAVGASEDPPDEPKKPKKPKKPKEPKKPKA